MDFDDFAIRAFKTLLAIYVLIALVVGATWPFWVFL